MSKTTNPVVELAIQKMGGQQAVADQLGLKAQSRISAMLYGEIPGKYVMAFHGMTDLPVDEILRSGCEQQLAA